MTTEFKRKEYEASNGKTYYTRSGWEHNYCSYLDWLKAQGEIKVWEYEPQRYYFIDNSVKPPRALGNGYLPDFKVINNDDSWYLVEIKGRRVRIIKLKRMKRFYPEIRIELIEQKDYLILKKKVGRLLNWD